MAWRKVKILMSVVNHESKKAVSNKKILNQSETISALIVKVYFIFNDFSDSNSLLVSGCSFCNPVIMQQLAMSYK